MIIESHGLHKRYGRFDVLRGIDLRVPEGSVYALIGPNGSGKTTTIRALMNILQPDAGRALVLGTPSTALSHQHFQHIGYVSESQKIPERLSVAEYLAYLRSLYETWDRDLERELLQLFELPSSQRVGQLSHGMRMKTLLIAALAFRPRLLVLDEPLSGLDTLVRDEVINGLLQQALDTTILISSHELSEIETFTTHVAFMQDGQLLLQEAIETLQERFRQVQVTLSANKTPPADWPSTWLLPEIGGHQLRFVCSDFSTDEQLYQAVSKRFGAVRVQAEAMGLRAIVNALMLARKRAVRI